MSVGVIMTTVTAQHTEHLWVDFCRKTNTACNVLFRSGPSPPVRSPAHQPGSVDGWSAVLHGLLAIASDIAITLWLVRTEKSVCACSMLLVCFSRYDHLKSAVWNPESGIRNLNSEIWNIKSEIWNMDSGISNLQPVIWNLNADIWNMKYEI